MKAQAIALVALMVLGLLSAHPIGLTPLGSEPQLAFSNTTTDSTFTGSTTEITGNVGDQILPTIPVNYGYSMTEGTLKLSLEGSQTSQTELFSITSGQLNGTYNGTTNDGSGVELTSASAGPPQAGTNSATILNTTTLVGTHAYDTLELLCGTASCGSIVATGDLTLYVNTLLVEQGTSIVANDISTGGTGSGGSTTATSSGRTNGGGGAGHGASGGSGGGSAGGSGGQAYGNGSERGSQGGDVSSSYHPSATGGDGGGYLRIFADEIIVNGSIQANGGNGDSGGQASSGTGAGGSGAGGGSGGSVHIRANDVDVGSNGQITANGGRGGNGANGAQNGVGFGMYDGGNGGGGGAGGRLVINTQAGGYSNAGLVQANSGAGGTKGYKYGTGVDGTDGSGGSNGVVTSGTWTGYLATGNLTYNDGTFQTHPLQNSPGAASKAYVSHNAVIPSDASLTAEYRYTVNGSDASFSEWSDWKPLSIAGDWIEAHQWFQVNYTFSRSGTTSPVLNSLSVETTEWTQISNADLTYDGTKLHPDLSQATFGVSTNFSDMSTPQQPQVSFEVPVGVTFEDDLSLWMQWTNPTAGPSSSITELLIGSTVVNTTSQNRLPEGVSLVLEAASLNAFQPATTWTDGNGLEWYSIPIGVNLSTPSAAWFDRLHVPWSIEISLNATNAVNEVILYECGTYYAFTDATCFGPSTAHQFSVSGQSIPTGSPAWTFSLSEPDFSWEDTYAPELASIQHRKGVEQLPDLRVNESFSVVLFDIVGEDDLTVEYLGLDWTEGDGFSQAQTMQHHNGLGGYYIYLDTDGLEVDFEHDYNMTFRLIDKNGNEYLPRPTYNLTVYPVKPEISSFTIQGPTYISGNTDASIWGISDAQLTLNVHDAHMRQTLMVRADLTPEAGQSNAQPLMLPLLWNPDLMSYSMDWIPQRADIGSWNVEITMEEMGGLMATDEDGWQDGVDAIVSLVDADGPTITNIQTNQSIEEGDLLDVHVEWVGSEQEIYEGSISIHQSGIELANKSILSTSSTSTNLVFDSTDWSPGVYSVSIHLEDDSGNSADSLVANDPTFTVLKPWLNWSLTIGLDDDASSIRVVGELESRSGTAVLTLIQDNGTWTTTSMLSNGPVDTIMMIDEYVAPSNTLTATLCDEQNLEDCESWSTIIDFSEAYSINATKVCFMPGYEGDTTSEQFIIGCDITNSGRTSISVAFIGEWGAYYNTTGLNIEPGTTGRIGLKLTEGAYNVNETLAWMLKATNEIGTTSVLGTGQTDVVRSIPQSDTPGENNAGQGEGAAGTIAIGVIVLLGAIGTLSYFYRTSPKDEKDLVELTQNRAIEADGDSNNVPIEDSPTKAELTPTMPPENASFSPSASAVPTSTDGNGYEWYSTEQGHWYRTAGSQGDWISYEP